MAIQLRRGDYEDFDKAKMQEGELAVVTTNDPNTESGCATYVSYASGDENKVKRLVHEDDYNNDFENLSAKIEQEVGELFTGLNLDEAIIRKAFDDLNINGENLYNEIQELKPKVIGENIEGDWKRVTIVIPDLTFSIYSGEALASVTLDNYIGDNIDDAIVTGVQSQIRSYPVVGTKVCPACYACTKLPTGVWVANLIDLNNNQSTRTVFTVIDVLYKESSTEVA